VKTATPNMKAANAKDHASWLRTAVITKATAANCTTARTAAVAIERSTFNRPTLRAQGWSLVNRPDQLLNTANGALVAGATPDESSPG
jgi:hypothetical protein